MHRIFPFVCIVQQIVYVLHRYAREKLKARRIKPTAEETKDKEEEQASYAPFEDPDTEARSLGQWQSVPAVAAASAADQPYVDLQLPFVPNDYVYVPAANVEPEAPVKIYKEKVVTSLAADGASGGVNEFKKRKGVAAKRNMRQRLDDD